jgi:hypothetical protein
MLTVLKYVCPVCGFLLDYPADNFNICPSCGVEFGLDDIEYKVEELQVLWFKRGLTWTSAVIPKPTDYNPFQQLLNLKPHGANIASRRDVSQARVPDVSNYRLSTTNSWTAGVVGAQFA